MKAVKTKGTLLRISTWKIGKWKTAIVPHHWHYAHIYFGYLNGISLQVRTKWQKYRGREMSLFRTIEYALGKCLLHGELFTAHMFDICLGSRFCCFIEWRALQNGNYVSKAFLLAAQITSTTAYSQHLLALVIERHTSAHNQSIYMYILYKHSTYVPRLVHRFVSLDMECVE